MSKRQLNFLKRNPKIGIAMTHWRPFLRGFGITFIVVLFCAAALVFLMNPYGNLRPTLFRHHVIMDINQRFQYPALIRSGDFDSIVMGTSDARLLRPKRLEEVFGGHFANLGINAGTAWEQHRLLDLFIREVERPRFLLMAIDQVWCKETAAEEDITPRGFPDWIYDDNRFNDLLYMLNAKAIETSVRRIGFLLTLKPAQFPAGYEEFTPPDKKYDLLKAQRKIWRGNQPQKIEPIYPPYHPEPDERASWRFPALDWLEDILNRFKGNVVVAFMPVHIRSQPVPGSLEAAKEAECKQRIADIARRYDAPVVDFRIWSDITSKDSNYWDSLHYRVSIAERIVDDIKRALVTRESDPKGDWVYLNGQEKETATH
jgi:hypothetical protein